MEGQDLRSVLDALIADFQERRLPELTRRRASLWRLPGKVDTVVGMRRSGKTYLLFQEMQDLLEGGVPRQQILYLNFEDERLLPMAAGDLHLVPEALFRRFPTARDQECWLFFDEIQNVAGWERFVRRLVDTGGFRIVLTGSSSRLLSTEIATSLRGRSLSTELLPFGFDEVLTHNGIELPTRWPPTSAARSRLEHAFRRYLEVGGFPEVQDVPDEARVRILQEYVDVALLRDVIERHGVTNVQALRYLVRRLVGSPATRLSVNRFYNDLKSQGLRVGKDTVHEHLSHLEEAYLAFTVPISGRSERARRVNPRKTYLVDHGLARAASFQASRNTGHLLENIVYLALRRRGYAVSYVTTRSGYEVDFLARKRDGAPSLVQVCAEPSVPETRTRELRALAEAMSEHHVDNAVVVTLYDEETITLEEGAVRVVPAWRWLLEE